MRWRKSSIQDAWKSYDSKNISPLYRIGNPISHCERTYFISRLKMWFQYAQIGRQCINLLKFSQWAQKNKYAFTRQFSL